MDEVVQAIENLSIRDWTDYPAIFAPFVLSIVAVWVSITTARKQNKIALFDKRYEIYTELLSLKKFCNIINNPETDFKFESMGPCPPRACLWYYSNIYNIDDGTFRNMDNMRQEIQKNMMLHKTILDKTFLLYNNSIQMEINRFIHKKQCLLTAATYYIDAIDIYDFDIALKEFQSYSINFYINIPAEMEKQLKL